MLVLDAKKFRKNLKKAEIVQIEKLQNDNFKLNLRLEELDNLNQDDPNDSKPMLLENIIYCIENIDDIFKDYTEFIRHEEIIKKMKCVPSVKKEKRRLL